MGEAMKPCALALLLLAGCGRYQIVPAHNSDDEIRVWRLDTITGVVRLCYESAAKVRCTEQI